VASARARILTNMIKSMIQRGVVSQSDIEATVKAIDFPSVKELDKLLVDVKAIAGDLDNILVGRGMTTDPIKDVLYDSEEAGEIFGTFDNIIDQLEILGLVSEEYDRIFREYNDVLFLIYNMVQQ